jgi:hypothetical protein
MWPGGAAADHGVMEPTVLAGPVEFSPADIAFILALLAGLFLVLTAPGWLVLAVASVHRCGATASTGRKVASGVGGALAGIAVSAVLVVASVAVLESFAWAVVPAVVLAWAACWALALAVRRGARRAHPAPHPSEAPRYGP